MIKVKVYAPPFCSFRHIDEGGYMTLPDKSVLNDVYKMLRIPLPFRKILFAAVNYKKAGLKQTLNDGDVISFFSGLAGG
ncbi:MAG: hypothetical protein R6U50_07550 [Desulfobacterales bacterium]